MTVKTREQKTWRKLTTQEWEEIEPLIPEPLRQGKRKMVTDRQVVDALLYRAYTKESWSRLPVPEGTHMAVLKRYTRWRDNGTLECIFAELGRMGLLPDEEETAEESKPEENLPPQWWELTQEQWEQIAPLLPPEPDGGKGKRNRAMLNALLYREYTNTPWREMPKEFGHWRTVYIRYSKWKEDGTLERVFDKMAWLGILSDDKYLLGRNEKCETSEAPEWWEVTDEQWQSLQPLFTAETQEKRGRKTKSDRLMLNAILCKFRTATVWTELPSKYGPWRTVIERYRRWRDDGTLQNIAQVLEEPCLMAGEKCSDGTTQEETLKWWELTDAQWESVAGLIPAGQRQRERHILNIILYREYTDTAWVALPEERVSWRTVYNRYAWWKSSGVLDCVFAKLKETGVLSEEKYLHGQMTGVDVNGTDWWEVTDAEWRKIAHLFPPKPANGRGRKVNSDRKTLDAILCRYHTGRAWLELPKKYGSWRTVLERYQVWRDDGTLDRIFEKLNK